MMMMMMMINLTIDRNNCLHKEAFLFVIFATATYQKKVACFVAKKASILAICDRTVCVVDRFQSVENHKIAFLYHEQQTTKVSTDWKVLGKRCQQIHAVIAIVILAI